MEENKEIEGINCIKVSLYFYPTYDKNKRLQQKIVLEEGKVVLPTNHKHGIRAKDSKGSYFGKTQGSWRDAVKEELKNNNVELVKSDKITAYKKFLKTKEDLLV